MSALEFLKSLESFATISNFLEFFGILLESVSQPGTLAIEILWNPLESVGWPGT